MLTSKEERLLAQFNKSCMGNACESCIQCPYEDHDDPKFPACRELAIEDLASFVDSLQSRIDAYESNT